MQIERLDRPGKGGAFIVRNPERDGKPRLWAEMTYQWLPDGLMLIDHTGVREPLRGQGTAGKLVATAVAAARDEGFRIYAQCPFARAVFDKTPEYADVRETERP